MRTTGKTCNPAAHPATPPAALHTTNARLTKRLNHRWTDPPDVSDQRVATSEVSVSQRFVNQPQGQSDSRWRMKGGVPPTGRSAVRHICRFRFQREPESHPTGRLTAEALHDPHRCTSGAVSTGLRRQDRLRRSTSGSSAPTARCSTARPSIAADRLRKSLRTWRLASGLQPSRRRRVGDHGHRPQGVVPDARFRRLTTSP